METLEKLRNGIEQLPKWLLLVLVIFLDGLVGGLYRAAGKTTAAKVIGWDHGRGLCAVDPVLCRAARRAGERLAHRDRRVYDRGHHHGHHEREDHLLCGLSAAAPAILSGLPGAPGSGKIFPEEMKKKS